MLHIFRRDGLGTINFPLHNVAKPGAIDALVSSCLCELKKNYMYACICIVFV